MLPVVAKSMGGFDIFLILIIAGFAFYGLFNGLIKTIGAIVAVIVGVWVANLFYLPLYGLAKKLFFGFDTLGQTVIFLVLFIIANRLIGLIFALIEGSYNSLFFIPFLKTINRLFGAIFGLVLGCLIVGLALYGLNQIGLAQTLLAKHLKTSQVAPLLLKYTGIIVPFLPNLWEKVKRLREVKSVDFKGVNLDSLNIDKLKDGGEYLKGKVWSESN